MTKTQMKHQARKLAPILALATAFVIVSSCSHKRTAEENRAPASSEVSTYDSAYDPSVKSTTLGNDPNDPLWTDSSATLWNESDRRPASVEAADTTDSPTPPSSGGRTMTTTDTAMTGTTTDTTTPPGVIPADPNATIPPAPG